ncbi:signal peptidase I [Thiolapillus sp.]
MSQEKTPISIVDFMVLIAVVGGFVWLLMRHDIESALAFATVASGVIWGGYRLFARKPNGARGADNADQGKKKKAEPLMVDYARSFFPIFLFVLLLRAFVVEPFRIPSGSMMPTLLVGDFILVNKFVYGLRMPVSKTKLVEIGEPERGDVVVFRYPKNPKLDYIKRLIGLPGDRIAYRNKTLYINGKVIPQEQIGTYHAVGSGMRSDGTLELRENLEGVQHSILVDTHRPDFPPGCYQLARGEITVPEGHYFVMGDNRDNSNDSRCWGFVPEKNLVGKAFMIWLSFDPNRSGIFDWSRIGQSID